MSVCATDFCLPCSETAEDSTKMNVLCEKLMEMYTVLSVLNQMSLKSKFRFYSESFNKQYLNILQTEQFHVLNFELLK